MGKHSAQARNVVEAEGIRDQSRMAMTRHEAWGNAREPDGGNAGMPSLGQYDSLRSKYCCFVEYRCEQTTQCAASMTLLNTAPDPHTPSQSLQNVR